MNEGANGRGALGFLRRVGAWLQTTPRPLAWLLLIGWMGAIAWLSSVPSSDLPPTPFGGFPGNLAHAGLYGLLALWAALGVEREGGWPRLDARAVASILGLVLAYALFDEWRQSLTPGRQPSAWDVMTDLAGASSTLVVAAYVGRPKALERGLWRRLAWGLAACSASATLATLG